MKRLLIVVAAAALVSCGGKPSTTPTTTASAVTVAQPDVASEVVGYLASFASYADDITRDGTDAAKLAATCELAHGETVDALAGPAAKANNAPAEYVFMLTAWSKATADCTSGHLTADLPQLVYTINALQAVTP